ncbi:MAG: nucleotide exchange factor GrpE [Candidatus Limiplasma sp.]|nr:nucleotide exchange factor GrpE [Candidatus Limiplasma sp.]
MRAKQKTGKNGGSTPKMKPLKDMEKQPVATPVETDQDTLEFMAGKLDDAAVCDAAGEDAAQEVAEAAAETIANELGDALAAANAKAEEYLTLAQRVQADFDNYRRRNQSARSEAFEDGARAFVTTLLPVLDNLERALSAANESPDTALKEGVEMVLRQLVEAFQKRGVAPIDRKGEKFDPNLENAVLQGAPEDGEPGTVCEVFQKGYQMGGTVLRHAMVKVVPD